MRRQDTKSNSRARRTDVTTLCSLILMSYKIFFENVRCCVDLWAPTVCKVTDVSGEFVRNVCSLVTCMHSLCSKVWTMSVMNLKRSVNSEERVKGFHGTGGVRFVRTLVNSVRSQKMFAELCFLFILKVHSYFFRGEVIAFTWKMMIILNVRCIHL